MMVLSQLPCLWIAPDPTSTRAHSRINRYFRDHFRIEPGDIGALGRFLERETAEHVLILEADILPGSALPHYIPDPVLLASGHSFRLLSLNSVTRGFDTRHGPVICTRKSLLSNQAIPAPEIVVPVALCDWNCNETALGAFTAAFNTIPVLPPGDAAFAACVGADVPHGLAWILGALTALEAPGDGSAAWASESPFLVDPSSAWARIRALARKLRLDRGLQLWPLDPGLSRLAKEISSDRPPVQLLRDIAVVFDSLGKEGEVVAARYRLAAM